ncbi:MAG TPA: CDP-alcohol phosphatidyltransferase family protein [Vicinamibacteria bacterium]|nr:CDP-alcohol phosphatidyltransferase family protein [Vicinamibacteria bacterium]
MRIERGTNVGVKESTLQQPPGWREILRAAAVAASKLVAGVFGFARDGIARGIIRIGIPANAVTLAGPVVVSLLFRPLFLGTQWLAGLVLIAAGAFDMLDGAVARISRRSTKFGGFLDSVTDRYTDFLMLFGILVYLLRHVHGPGRTPYLILFGFTVVGTATTSYIRARAENVIPECKVGFMERAERTVTIIIGLLASNVHITLWILAVFTNLISIQRIFYARMVMNDREPKSLFWLWRYPRLTAPHFTLCAALILFLIIGHLFIPRP